MLGYEGTGGNDFSAQPRVVQPYRFKDPYGQAVQEYYPQNIMYDKRIQRGSTFAAMVIPAGTSPDTMVMDKSQTMRAGTMKDKQKARFIYPDRNIPTPEPVHGRVHMDVQTEEYFERLTDKPAASEQGVFTEFYLDRPPVPLFQPRMPSKDCCKSTQIHDGDPELFDFDAEVEPMLNVLCERTLEQARMEVLEEEEMRIIKAQQKEYEEVRNAELIEAQRFEAAELRVKQETQRRAIQQRARKAQKKAAHQKYICRVMAKGELVGLREGAFRHLADLSLMQKPLESEIRGQVMPWLNDKITGYMGDNIGVAEVSELMLTLGIEKSAKDHKDTLKRRDEKLAQDERDRKKAARDNEIRKQNRRAAREKRAKDQKREALKQEVRKLFVAHDASRVVTPADKFELLDVHGNYQKGAPFCGGLGGQIQQMYYVISTIIKNYGTDLVEYYSKCREDPSDVNLQKPSNPREIMVDNLFLPFIISYIGNMASDLCIFQQPELAAVIESFNEATAGKKKRRKKQPIASEEEENLGPKGPDLTKLTEEQTQQFRHAIIEARLFDETLVANPDRKSMEMLLTALYMLITQKVPEEVVTKMTKDTKGFNIENIYAKIVLTAVPEGTIIKDTVVSKKVTNSAGAEILEDVKTLANTGEKCFVRLRVPMREQTNSEYEASKPPKTANDDEVEIPQTADPNDEPLAMVEEQQDDKALAVLARSGAAPYSIFCSNQYAQRQCRAELIQVISKTTPDWFLDSNRLQDITESAEQLCEDVESHYISKKCGEYVMPCFDFNINAPDFD